MFIFHAKYSMFGFSNADWDKNALLGRFLQCHAPPKLVRILNRLITNLTINMLSVSPPDIIVKYIRHFTLFPQCSNIHTSKSGNRWMRYQEHYTHRNQQQGDGNQCLSAMCLSNVDWEKNALFGHFSHSHAPSVSLWTNTLCRLNSIGLDIFL